MNCRLLLFVLIVGCFLPAACSDPLARTGRARVTGLDAQGFMTMQYEDGSIKHKRVDPGAAPEDMEMVVENLLQPARYVETNKGSTLTFPSGDTIQYFDAAKGPGP